MSDSETPAVRAEIIAICQEHLARLGEEAGRVAEDRLATLASKTAADTAALLDQIAASTRRIRAAGDAAAVLVELADSVGQLCDRAVVLLNDGDRLTGFRASGGESPAESTDLRQVSFDLASAPALAHAVETKDAMVITGGQHNVSHQLASKLGYSDDTELRAVPLVLRDTVLGLVLVDGAAVRESAIESLILTAEAWIEALNSRPKT
ncbi:MAG: hypothetical protein F4Y47_08280 [Acidobacteriia bacterium]|nr:hypothetical protein [Terriglobia bacterium]MYG02468.1 hypothetical protein [Terriglobia bacterium]MYK11842.1 hypothetical protein [Terriglobia bacterium]